MIKSTPLISDVNATEPILNLCVTPDTFIYYYIPDESKQRVTERSSTFPLAIMIEVPDWNSRANHVLVAAMEEKNGPYATSHTKTNHD